jgi:uncharacterized repeat protein (TIGR03803 family)
MDGTYPSAGLVLDGSGNLYGTTFSGGLYNYGTVFELTPTNGGWTEQVLHQFNYSVININGPDGFYPQSALILDATDNLYGTTVEGGIYDGGTVFEITP